MRRSYDMTPSGNDSSQRRGDFCAPSFWTKGHRVSMAMTLTSDQTDYSRNAGSHRGGGFFLRATNEPIEARKKTLPSMLALVRRCSPCTVRSSASIMHMHLWHPVISTRSLLRALASAHHQCHVLWAASRGMRPRHMLWICVVRDACVPCVRDLGHVLGVTCSGSHARGHVLGSRARTHSGSRAR
jgi:hypothetical protein